LDDLEGSVVFLCHVRRTECSIARTTGVVFLPPPVIPVDMSASGIRFLLGAHFGRIRRRVRRGPRESIGATKTIQARRTVSAAPRWKERGEVFDGTTSKRARGARPKRIPISDLFEFGWKASPRSSSADRSLFPAPLWSMVGPDEFILSSQEVNRGGTEHCMAPCLSSL